MTGNLSAGRNLLLGLDVGTTAAKALLFDLDGAVIASATQAYGLLTPQAGWVEQNPEELWRGVVAAIRAALAQIGPGDRVMALAQSSQGGTTLLVDADGAPIGHAISWMDERGTAQAQRIQETLGAEWVYTTTGWPLGAALPLQHLGWLRDHRPADLARARYVQFVNDFVIQRLTGERRMNPSDASITQLFNLTTGDWDGRLLDAVGVRRVQLAPVVPSGQPIGHLTAAAAEATGLPRETLVVNGAHDQYCAAVGAGVTQPGAVLLSCGTAWVVLAVPASLDVGLRSGMAISRHAVPERWGAIRSLGGVGASVEWFLDQIWRDTDRYASLTTGVARSPVGANGVRFAPLAGGHETWRMGQGSFWNLGLDHTRDDMARAVLEGIALELCWVLDEMRAHGVIVHTLKMVGGAAESQIWPQIIADVTGVPIVLPSCRQAGARGAAILAGVGAGLFPDGEAGFAAFQGQETRLAPNAQHHKLYVESFESYRSDGNEVGRT